MHKATYVNIIKYKQLLDASILQFIVLFGKDFEFQDGRLMLCTSLSKSKLQSIFTELIGNELKHYIDPHFSVLRPSYCLVIGDCSPISNAVLCCADTRSLPQKLLHIAEQLPNVKYILHDKSIHVDIALFNDVFNSIFQDMFMHQDHLDTLSGSNASNVFFIQHSHADSVTLAKLLAAAYGKSNCSFVHNIDPPIPFASLNSLLYRHVTGRQKAAKPELFKKIAAEAKQFVDAKMKEAMEKAANG